MLTKNEVRLSLGVPTVELFVSAVGTPIVIDITTGQAYFLDSTGNVAPFKLSADDLIGILTQSKGGWGEDSTNIWDIAAQTLTATAANLDFLVFPKESGKGVKVDQVSPSFGWRDLLGRVSVRGTGAADPALTIYRGSNRQFQFSNAITNEVFLEIHLPHDYVMGSDVYLHTHWSQIAVDSGGPAGVPGNVKWSFDLLYAKGHNQGAFSAPITAFVTQTASGTQYQHMIAEVQISSSTPSATQLSSSTLEPDGVLLVRVWRNPNDAADTLNQAPFLHFADLHYQSTSIGTKQKAPDFYA